MALGDGQERRRRLLFFREALLLLLLVVLLAVSSVQSVQLEPKPHAGHPNDKLKKEVVAPVASVFAEHDDSLEGSKKGFVTAELARFVTAYKKGFETLIDVTPHALLLNSAADKTKKVHFYTFIDTWVNNDTSTSLYLNNETGKCSPLSSSQGNGFAFTAELLLWGKNHRLDTRPRKSITLAPGYFGGRYGFGNVEVLEGTVTSGKSVTLDKPLRGSSQDFAAPPPVYECKDGTAGVHHAALLGYAATEVVHFERYLKMAKPSTTLEMTARKNLARSLVEALVKTHLVPLTKVTGVHSTSSTHHDSKGNVTVAMATFDHTKATPVVGTKVYYDGGVATDHYDPRMRRWVNATYPFEPVGTVAAVKGSTLTLHLSHSCLPASKTSGLPKFVIPNSAKVIPDAEALVASSFRRGQKLVEEWRLSLQKKQFKKASAADVDGYARFVPEAGEFMEPLLLESKDHLLKTPILIGRLRLGSDDTSHAGQSTIPLAKKAQPELGLNPSAEELEQGESASTRACIVVQRHQGHLFDRSFDIGHLEKGERVLAQLTVTGHGWAATSEQCGEYCHAVYHMVVNGKSAANVTQFRDDCSQNPISDQYGTWEESRNGWCPGSVEHGLYLDVTKAIKSGSNDLTLSASVWSHQRQRYEAYTNLAGFVFQDDASLTVDLNLFVYAADTVKRILKQTKPYTEAEVALFHGSSHRASLSPKQPVPPTGEAAAAALLEPPRIASRRMEATSRPQPRQKDGSRQRLMRSEGDDAEADSKTTPKKDKDKDRTDHEEEKTKQPQQQLHKEQHKEQRHTKQEHDAETTSSANASSSVSSNTPSSSSSNSSADSTSETSSSNASSSPSSSSSNSDSDSTNTTNTTNIANSSSDSSSSSSSSSPSSSSSSSSSDAASPNEPFDFPSRSPWYQFDEVNEGTLKAKVVTIFAQALLQSDTRTVWASLDSKLLADYTQAALRIKLEAPEGLDIDDWDRQASFGLLLHKGGQDAIVQIADPPIRKKVPLTPSAHAPEGAVPLPEASMVQASHSTSG